MRLLYCPPGTLQPIQKEDKYRATFRLRGDLRRTVQSLLEQDCELDQDKVNGEEMIYPEFQKSWTKINNSTPKRKIDPALVWLDIKSYIKGSLEALQLDSDERDVPMHRSDFAKMEKENSTSPMLLQFIPKTKFPKVHL